MARRISVVVSQGQSSNPVKRKLEEDLITSLLMEPGIDVTVLPHLYDIANGSTGQLALQQIDSNMIVCSWLFERAVHWVLDRNAIRGHRGQVLLQDEADDEDEDEAELAEEKAAGDDKIRVDASREKPNRRIYCIDLRVSTKVAEFIEEIKRIQTENSVQVVGLGGLKPAAGNGTAKPSNGSVALPIIAGPSTNGSSNGHAHSNGHVESNGAVAEQDSSPSTVQRIDEDAARRWYPVIDYSRCTNCMECIDFCLFGVYGVDRIDTILVEQPDNCRKGCPACSRVCPENAIMFPQHKTPAIAGSNELVAALKIDLSQLFGAPADDRSAIEVAAAERDEQLAMAGRDTVGLNVGIPKRHIEPNGSKDELDRLVDQLDDLDV